MSAFVAAAALTVGALGTTAAEAKPTKPGGVSGLTASAAATSVSPTQTKYDVTTGWNATANATSYKVTLTKGGTTLASASVTSTSWSPTVRTTPGSASLQVRALIGKRQGKPSSVSVKLDDVNAPTGSYTSKWSNDTGVATITQAALADDSGTAGVTRTVNWHQTDGSPDVAWPSGTTLDHTYPLTAARYVPTVTLTDAAGNHVTIDVPAVVINDTTAPTAGSYTVSTLSPWAKLTKVEVTETAAPTDLWSSDAFIVRTVDWGDGSSSTWTGTGSGHHVYADGGSYLVVVTDTDEAHNVTTAQSFSIVAKADTVAPKVSIAAAKSAHSVNAWRTLHGKATDTAGTGVKTVTVKAVEKRGAAWYGYNAKTHKWLKAATKTKAFKRAVAFSRTTDARHRWTAALRGLAKGTLVARASAVDLVGNHSASVTRSARLTTR